MTSDGERPIVRRLRGSPAWPLVRAVGRPAREVLRAAHRLSVPVRGRARRARRAAPVHARALGARITARAPIIADLTWRPARRLRGWVRDRPRALRAWRVRRDPHRHARRYLDAPWYLSRLPEPPPPGTDPYHHYRTVGVALGLAPNPVFDVEVYRYDHPDVADHGGDPLLHWVLAGREAGATPHPLFDPAWYRRAHAIGGADPYLHYLLSGRAAGLAPCAALDAGEDPAAGYPIVLPRDDPETVTIVIPAYRSAAMTLRCLAAVARRTPASPGVRVLLADDDPTRPLGPILASRVEGLDLRVNPVNLGFLRSCNAAAGDARGEHLVLLNNDTVVLDGWLDALLAPVAADPAVAMVGGRLLNTDGSLQEAGVIMYRDGWGVPYGRDDDPERPQYRFVRRVDAVTGACFLVRRSAFEAVGRFNDDLAPAFFEEYDLAYALRARGWDTVYAPGCRVLHAGSATYGSETRDRQSTRNHATFAARWADLLATAREGPADELLARERPRRGGVVLVVDDRVPEHDRHAGSLFVRQQLDLLVEADCRVVYVPYDGVLRQPHAAAMEAAGMEVLAPGVDLEAWLEEHGRHVDRVLIARPHIAERWLPSIRRRCPRARVAYFTHDLHHLREQRRHAATGEPDALAEARRLEVQETAVLRAVDAILTPSEAELAPIAALAPGVPAWALPPFAAETPLAGPPLAERRDVMFLGGYEHLPNVDAARLLATDIMPRVWAAVPDARLLLVGADPPPAVLALAGERVEVTGFVPDLATCYARARLTLSPLRYGAGLKGKIVSSLEAGVPVVTTAMGNEGLGLRDGVEALLAETPADLAAAAVRLLADPDLATALADAGRAFVLGRLSRERARATLHAALALPAPGAGEAGPRGTLRVPSEQAA